LESALGGRTVHHADHHRMAAASLRSDAVGIPTYHWSLAERITIMFIRLGSCQLTAYLP
jgi:hypothetical protein